VGDLGIVRRRASRDAPVPSDSPGPGEPRRAAHDTPACPPACPQGTPGAQDSPQDAPAPGPSPKTADPSDAVQPDGRGSSLVADYSDSESD
jgi:hypothetical protein